MLEQVNGLTQLVDQHGGAYRSLTGTGDLGVECAADEAKQRPACMKEWRKEYLRAFMMIGVV